ncbi:hypothetical protein F1559_003304 [Cyanidiococcus yangmingshanensis]|uniref:Protein kinase domain-containing protein n=1 Tax=Cyanidiococcus yangmingshanensis TaxID=2690220 RepID=A0A7J7II33_9RHOD|nr:hypothetical protein F1559_003304 [Cyanidiococcus yangmingshanensis]
MDADDSSSGTDLSAVALSVSSSSSSVSSSLQSPSSSASRSSVPLQGSDAEVSISCSFSGATAAAAGLGLTMRTIMTPRPMEYAASPSDAGAESLKGSMNVLSASSATITTHRVASLDGAETHESVHSADVIERSSSMPTEPVTGNQSRRQTRALHQRQRQRQVLAWLLSQLSARMEPTQAAHAWRRWQRKLGIDSPNEDGIPPAPLTVDLDDFVLSTSTLSIAKDETEGVPLFSEYSVRRCLGHRAWRLARHLLTLEPLESTREERRMPSSPERLRREPLRAGPEAMKTSAGNITKRSSRFETDFEMLALLGRGGFGAVVKARQRLDGRLYAIKIVPLHRQDLEDPRILRETTTLSRLSHPRCVRYYGCWVESAEALLSITTITETAANDSKDVKEHRDPTCVQIASSKNPQGTKTDTYALQALLRELSCSVSSSEPSEQTMSPPRAIVAFLFIQMEYCPRTLRAFIDQDIDAGIDLWAIFRQIVEGVQYLHSLMLLHRDLKPTNIFVVGPWETSQIEADAGSRSEDWPVDNNLISIKIGDFGLATMISMASLSRTERSPQGEAASATTPEQRDSSSIDKGAAELTRSVGTAFYRAPELSAHSSGPTSADRNVDAVAKQGGGVASAAPSYDTKVDIYSLGVILFELFYGPMTGGSGMTTEHERHVILTALRERLEVPPAFAEKLPRQTRLVRLLMAKDPHQRPSAETLLKMLPAKVEHEYWSELLQTIRDPVSSSDRQLRIRTVRTLFESARRERERYRHGLHQSCGMTDQRTGRQHTPVCHSRLETPSLPWNWVTRAYVLLKRHHGQEFVLKSVGDDTNHEPLALPVLLSNGEYGWLPSERFRPFIHQWFTSASTREAIAFSSSTVNWRYTRLGPVWQWRAVDAGGRPVDMFSDEGIDAEQVDGPGLVGALRSRTSQSAYRHNQTDAFHQSGTKQGDSLVRRMDEALGPQRLRSVGVADTLRTEAVAPTTTTSSSSTPSGGRFRVLQADILLEFDQLQLGESRLTGAPLFDAELLFIATTLVNHLCLDDERAVLGAGPEQRHLQQTRLHGRGHSTRRRDRRTESSESTLMPSVEGVLIRLGHTRLTRTLTAALLALTRSTGLRLEEERDATGNRALQTLRAALHQHPRLGWNGIMRQLAPDHPWQQVSARATRRQAEELVHASQKLAPLSMLHLLRTKTTAITNGSAALMESFAQLERVLRQWSLLLDRAEWLDRWPPGPLKQDETTRATSGEAVLSSEEQPPPVSQPWPPQGPYRVLLDPFLWPSGPNVNRFADADGLCFEVSLITPADMLRTFRPVVWAGHWQLSLVAEATRERPKQQTSGATNSDSSATILRGRGLVADLSLLERFCRYTTFIEQPFERPMPAIYLGVLREPSSSVPNTAAETTFLITLGALWRRGWTCFLDAFDDDADQEAGRSKHEHLQRAAQYKCRIVILVRTDGTTVHIRELHPQPDAESESRASHSRAERVHEITLEMEQPGQVSALAQRVAQTVHDLMQKR